MTVGTITEFDRTLLAPGFNDSRRTFQQLSGVYPSCCCYSAKFDEPPTSCPVGST